jgi:hypothetical protein
MASVTAFNDMMGQFLVELHKTFPDEKNIKKMLTSFDLLKSTNPRLLVDGFMKSVSPHADSISRRMNCLSSFIPMISSFSQSLISSGFGSV